MEALGVTLSYLISLYPRCSSTKWGYETLSHKVLSGLKWELKSMPYKVATHLMPAAIIRITVMGDGFSEQICIPLGGKEHQPSVTAPAKVRGSFLPFMQKDKGIFHLSSSKELSQTTIERWKWLHFHSSSRGSFGWHRQQSFKHLILACPDSLPWPLPVLPPPSTGWAAELGSRWSPSELQGSLGQQKAPELPPGYFRSCKVISLSDLSSHSQTMPALQCHIEMATREWLLK